MRTIKNTWKSLLFQPDADIRGVDHLILVVARAGRIPGRCVFLMFRLAHVNRLEVVLCQFRRRLGRLPVIRTRFSVRAQQCTSVCGHGGKNQQVNIVTGWTVQREIILRPCPLCPKSNFICRYRLFYFRQTDNPITRQKSHIIDYTEKNDVKDVYAFINLLWPKRWHVTRKFVLRQESN